MRIQQREVPRLRLQGNPAQLRPDAERIRIAGLQGRRCRPRLVHARGIGPAGGSRLRVEHLQVVLGQRRHGARREVGPAPAYFRQQHAHLQAPVAEMGVRQRGYALRAQDAAQALADHQGAQVPDMQGLGDVGAAEIQHDQAALDRLDADMHRVRRLHLGALREKVRREPQVEEAGSGDTDLVELGPVGQQDGDLACDLARVAPGRLGKRHHTVALQVGKLRPRRPRGARGVGRQSGGGKGAGQQIVDAAYQRGRHAERPKRLSVSSARPRAP